MVSLDNGDSKFISPKYQVFSQSLVHHTLDEEKIPEHAHDTEWPIIMVFYGLYEKKHPRGQEITQLFKWMILEGDETAKRLGYVPVDEKIEKKNHPSS